MTTKDILSNAFVVTGGGPRLEQFKKTFTACGLDPSLVKEWRECRIEGEGSLGNAVAQYSLVRFAKQTGMPFLLVFEDDAVPCDNAADELVKAFDSRPADCLCLSLGWSQSYPKVEEDQIKRSDLKRVYGSQAYVLFGEKAYDEFLSKWEQNGRADVVLGLMSGSYMGKEPLFAQHTIGKSIHLPQGWAVDQDYEKEADEDLLKRYSKAQAAIAEQKAERTIHVAYTIDVQGPGAAQFCDQLVVSLYSMKKSMAKEDIVHAHIFYNNVPADVMRKVMALGSDRFQIAFKPLPRELMVKLEACSGRNPRARVRMFSGITFARFCLPILLPKVDRVIYIDADTLVRTSLRELWNVELGEKEVIAAPYGVVPEYGFYSGTIVMDLKKMRSGDNVVGKFLAYSEKEAHKFYLPDQTAMNRFFAGAIKLIDSKWIFPPTPGEHNKQMWDAPIWHFYNGPKPYRINSDDAGASLIQWNNFLADAEAEIAASL